MLISEAIDNTVREVPDFPKPGIMFKDITPILKNVELTNAIVNEVVDTFKSTKIDAVIGIESRGFLFGMAIAQAMKVPFCMVRKKGKLPGKTIEYSYDLEYGNATVEMHENEIDPNWNVLIHDDLLATGGTACAAAELVIKQGGKVAGFNFIIGLDFLRGIDKLQHYSTNIVSLKTY
jgi:adenine phosphoribosyltransferase